MDWIARAMKHFSFILQCLPFEMTGSSTETVVDSIYTELEKIPVPFLGTLL